MDPVGLASAAVALFCAFLTYRASRQATDVNERANQLEWVKELRVERHQLAGEVEKLSTKVATLSRELDVVTREAEQLIREMQLFRRTAWRDGMTIERYREFIGPPPPPAMNGRSV